MRFSINALSRLIVLCAAQALLLAQPPAPLRPPAVPLVTHNPYFSVWSFADRLTDAATTHWTGKPNRLTALIRIDGKTFQVMGRERRPSAVLEQKRLQVLPTRTIYDFAGEGIHLELTFFTPALPQDLDILSRPATYIEYTVSSTDGNPHKLELYFDAASDLVVNTPDQPVWWGRYSLDGQPVLRMGSRGQAVLQRRGDDVRIDWGYLYLTTDGRPGASSAILPHTEARKNFETSGSLPDSDDLRDGTAPGAGSTEALAVSLDLGAVGATPVSRYLILAYDDLYSIEYFHRAERAWWRRNGAGAAELLRDVRRDHDSLLERGKAFDEELMADMRAAGGEEYARLGALAYRQTLAAHQLAADADGTAMYFPKENFSNGCISTVDVIYPSAPFTLLFNPLLLKAQLEPVLQYAHMPRWPWPFAPHDLGTYPQANGQVYGGGERTEENQMPVEESGNMLILVAALAKVEGNASYAEKYWPELTKWAEYLKTKGLDPENQLSTDDFAGHLAHNANLSLKAILALGAYGTLCQATERTADAAAYRDLSHDYAKKWMELAAEGDRYRLAFDKPGTWSQKYNLVWDRILGLDLFPAEVARKEIALYETKQNRYGVPLDNRRDYTKLDWTIWSATLAHDRSDFEKLIAPVYRWLDESPSRVPLTDWYDTVTGKQQGFQARSVVGGVFVKMLTDPAVWHKYTARALSK
ncbi:MAG: glutaminase domain-containing protein [Bryobacteraceae bacterium]